MDNPGDLGVCWDSFEEEPNSKKRRGLKLDVFDPQLFRKNGEMVIAKLENYLGDFSIRGLALTDPSVLLQTAKDLMTSEIEDEEKLGAIIDLYIRTGIQVHSPGYMGRQFSGVIPLASIIDFMIVLSMS